MPGHHQDGHGHVLTTLGLSVSQVLLFDSLNLQIPIFAGKATLCEANLVVFRPELELSMLEVVQHLPAIF